MPKIKVLRLTRPVKPAVMRRTVPKPKKKNKPGAGRPPVVLDEKKIGELAFNGCKNSEIAHILGCDDDTLKDNYSPILNKKRAERKAAFRTAQTKKALAFGSEGQATMLIWVGKNELEQSDKHSIEGDILHREQLSITDLQKSVKAYEEAAK